MEQKDSLFDDSLRALAKSSVIIFIGIFISKLLTYVYRILIARTYGPEGYGLFSLAVMVSGWFITFSALGLNEGLNRYIPLYRGKKQGDKISYIIRKAIYSRLITGIIFGAILFFAAPFISINIFKEPNLIIFLRYFSIIVPVSLLLGIFSTALKSYERMSAYTVFSNFIEPVLNVALISLFIFLGFDNTAIIFSYLISTSFNLLAIYLFISIKIPKAMEKSKKKYPRVFKELLSYSWPLLFVGLIWKIFSWSDSFVIGYFQNVADVGIYNAAVPIAALLSMASLIFLQLFFPMVTRIYSTGKKETVKQLSQQIGKWLLAINIPLFILILLFPGAFLNILFGKEYLVAENALRLLSIGFFFITFSDIPNKLIAMSGRSKLIFIDMIFMSVVNLALNILLIPKYGINGAAFSTMTSSILLTLIFLFQTKKILNIFPLRRKIINLFTAAIISAGLLLYLRSFIEVTLISLILLSLFFGGLYFLLILLFGGLDRNDLMILGNVLSRLKFGKFKKN